MIKFQKLFEEYQFEFSFMIACISTASMHRFNLRERDRNVIKRMINRILNRNNVELPPIIEENVEDLPKPKGTKRKMKAICY